MNFRGGGEYFYLLLAIYNLKKHKILARSICIVAKVLIVKVQACITCISFCRQENMFGNSVTYQFNHSAGAGSQAICLINYFLNRGRRYLAQVHDQYEVNKNVNRCWKDARGRNVCVCVTLGIVKYVQIGMMTQSHK